MVFARYIRARGLRIGGAVLILIVLLPLCAIEAIYRVRLASIPLRPAITTTPRLYPVHRVAWEWDEAAPMIMDPVWPWTIVDDLASGPRRGRRGDTIAYRVAELHIAELRQGGLVPPRSKPHWLTPWMLAIWVSRHMTAEQAIVWYLDHAHYGRGARGIEEASAVFFGRRPAQLGWAEAALVPGMLLSPRRYDPGCEAERAGAYQAQVLERLWLQGFVSAGPCPPPPSRSMTPPCPASASKAPSPDPRAVPSSSGAPARSPAAW